MRQKPVRHLFRSFRQLAGVGPDVIRDDLPDRELGKSTSGGTSKPPKHVGGLGTTREDLEQINKYVARLGLQDPKYINFKPESRLYKLSQTDRIRICTRETLYADPFEAVEAWRIEQGLEPSVPLDLEVNSDDLENRNLEEDEYIRVSLAERFRVFDGLEDHSPPFVTEGNVAVPFLDGGKLRSGLEYH